MKDKKLFGGILVIMLLILVGCNDDSVQHERINLPIEAELPVYYAPYSDTALIAESDIEFQHESLTLNSNAEVEKCLSKRFLQAYPEYAKIDFSRYSLLVFTSIQPGDIVGRKTGYYKEVTSGRYFYSVRYLVDREEDREPSLYFERLGVVVKKLKPGVVVDCVRSCTYQ